MRTHPLGNDREDCQRLVRFFRPSGLRKTGFQEGHALSLNDTPRSSVEKDLMNTPLVRWGLMLFGIAISFLALDILLRRPLMNELASVKRDLANVEKGLHDLVGVKDVAWETNHLLSALQAQKRQLESARAALGDVREFRMSVEKEAQQTGDAVAALDRIAELQKQVVRQREQSAGVEQVLANIFKLHESLISQKPGAARSGDQCKSHGRTASASP